MTLVELLEKIGDAIRYAEGSKDLIPVIEMADRIKARADIEDSIVENTIIEYVNDRAANIGAYSIQRKPNMEFVSFEKAVAINGNAFYACPKLTTAIFGNAGAIGANCFYSCTSLNALVIKRTDRYCALMSSGALSNTPISNGKGYVFVPSTLVDTYKTATNWSAYTDQIVAIEDYQLQIIQQPTEDIEVVAGDIMTAEVVVMAIGAKYQWQISSDGVSWTDSTTSYGTTANWKATANSSHNGKLLRCVIQDMYGNEIITTPVKITVTE